MSMSDFKPFAQAVNARFNELSKGELFVVGDNEKGNRIFEQAYLAAFPEGTNPIYKTNTHHDCNCCKNFIRNLGNLVSIENGEIKTIWDIDTTGVGPEYIVVAKAMDEFVKSFPIIDLFRSEFSNYGAEVSRAIADDGKVINWNHFYGTVSKRHQLNGQRATGATRYKSVAQETGEYRGNVDVLKRSMELLKPEFVKLIIDLIEDDATNIYRGREKLGILKAFQKAQGEYMEAKSKGSRDLEIWCWKNGHNPAISKFKNDVVGTLIENLSNGVSLQESVRIYEAFTAPTNYKRPKALITESMVKEAMTTLEELGLKDAIHRRFAKISDVSINDVLWANASSAAVMKDSVVESLLAVAKKPTPTGSLNDISIKDFMADVAPTCTSIEVLLRNNKLNNFVSLTAPVHPGSGKLFKWDNDFAWSYDGNITDSIKEKVKAAGGNVTNAALRVSLAWHNHDDLDLHIMEPKPGGEHIYFGNRISRKTGGNLDVDMNAGSRMSREPVENISYTKIPHDGSYRVQVSCWSKRERSDDGCTVEIEFDGQVHQYSNPGCIESTHDVIEIVVKGGKVAEVKLLDTRYNGAGISSEKWGLKTNEYVPVASIMYSPNYWGQNEVGNKHYIFALEGCVNTNPTRGIYNEFLRKELEPHGKVFEVLGDKTKCQPGDDVSGYQLSGLGFSTTRKDEVILRVKTKEGKTLSYNVKF